MLFAARFLALFAFCAVPLLPTVAAESAQAANPMANFKPDVVKDAKTDREEIVAFLHRMKRASEKGDLTAAANAVDFPVLMVTDNSKGEGTSSVWTREEWTKRMAPFYAKPLSATEMVHKKPTILLLSDSLAVVYSEWTMKLDGKKIPGSSAMMLLREKGEWKSKAMMEGGWGDMGPAQAEAQPAQSGSDMGTGTGSEREEPSAPPAEDQQEGNSPPPGSTEAR